MSDVTVESFNQFITALLAIVVLAVFVIWAIPNGHCPNDCSCKKTNRSHK